MKHRSLEVGQFRELFRFYSRLRVEAARQRVPSASTQITRADNDDCARRATYSVGLFAHAPGAEPMPAMSSRRDVLLVQLPIPPLGPAPIRGNVPLAAAYLTLFARRQGLDRF